jgi:hypothetical protein
MPNNDNGNGRLWEVVKAILEDVGQAGSAFTPDNVAQQVVRRHPELQGEDGWTAFLARVVAVLKAHGLLTGEGPGAGIKALTTDALRQRAGLSMNGPTPGDAEVAAALVLGASPGHSADAGRRRPAPAAEAALSLESLTAKAAAAREEERLAEVLTPASTRRARR